MPTPDLPLELWFEILSYLPRSYLFKMIGLNRMFFRIAMEYKYEEVRFTTDDKGTFEVFKQLRLAVLLEPLRVLGEYSRTSHRHMNVASLVRRLYLRPAFLPAMDNAFHGTVREGAATSKLSWLKHLSPVPRIRTVFGTAEENKVLTMARDALPNCRNLREVDLIIYDHIIPDDFRDFLCHIWRTMGAGIQRVNLSTTLNKVPDLFSLIAQHAPLLPNLEILDLTVVNSRFPRQKDTVDHALDAIVGLIHRFKASLTHLIFSSVAEFDHAPLFAKLGTLPKLRKLELWFVFCDETISNRGRALNQFLNDNNQTLEHLVLKTRPRFESFFLSSHTERLSQWVLYQLPKLVLPQVKTLDLGLTTYHMTGPNHFPLLLPIFPQLHTLILFDVKLSIKQLERILDQAEGKLQRLECLVWTFTPEMLTLLVSKAPQLRSLVLIYQSMDGTRERSIYAGLVGIYRRIAAMRYPQWPLTYLRIGQRGHSCGQCHPDKRLSKVIKESVSEGVVADVDMQCECYGRFTGLRRDEW